MDYPKAIMSRSGAKVVRMKDGSEFQISIVKSK